MPAESDAARRRLSRVLAIIFGGLLAFILGFALWHRQGISNIARNWDAISDGSAMARELHYPEDLLEYMVTHVDEVSLVAYRVGDETNGIYVNADRPRTLAGLHSLLALCDYNAAIDTGAVQPNEAVAVADWERFLLPETDGGSHARTLAQLRTSPEVTNDQVQLQDLVFGMVRFNDHAATDYVLQRLGRARLDALPAAFGMAHSEPPLPWSGLFLSWESGKDSAEQRLARYQALGREVYASEVWRLSQQLYNDPQLRAATHERLTGQAGPALKLAELARLAHALSPKGTAREYADLTARIARGELPGSAAIQAELQWPLQQPEVHSRFERYGSKTGSLPGALTAASFATPKSAGPLVAVFLLDGLPIAVWLELMHSFLHQRLEQDLLADPAFFERVRERLGAAANSVTTSR
ncbi:MAG: hypothetical protein ABW321_02010 [Polyangiales bacterium]